MRMRILHVSPYGEAAWAYGGIPRVVGALSRGLAKRGHIVTVCTTDVCDEWNRLPNSGRPEGRPLRGKGGVPCVVMKGRPLRAMSAGLDQSTPRKFGTDTDSSNERRRR